ncbi:MAG: hypothetical protein AB7O68_03480 [Pirellulales bacterium]
MAVVCWLMAGLFTLLLNIGRGRPASVTDVFSGTRYLWRLLLAFLLIYAVEIAGVAVTLGPGFAAAFAMGGSHPVSITLLIVGGVALLAALIYVGLGISQYILVIVDQDSGVIESFRTSWSIMRGNRLSFFALALSASLLGICGVLACLVGALITMPFFYFVISLAYLVMTGQPTAESLHRPAAPAGGPLPAAP